MSEGARILVIEDETLIRDRIVRILGFEGYRAEGAEDGRGGIEHAWRTRPDLIICDLLLPGINGFGVCRVLRDDLRSSHIPIVALSALAAESDRERAHQLGVTVYVTKPFRNETLLRAVRMCLGEDGSRPTRVSCP